MNKKTIADIDVKGKRCLVRVDFNVPLDENNKITDENRIQGALPTIKYLMEHGAKVILCSHLGRPKGTFNMKYSLKPVADRLNELLGGKVTFAADVIGDSAKTAVANCKEGEVVLLENLRFHAEEEKNDPEFCKALASYADIYVNDAFGTAHRAHASTAGVASYVKTAVAGFLIGKELDVMGGALEDPKRPFVAILGGAKVSDKIGVINNLLEKVDTLIIGGAMAYTFLKAKGYEVGTSLLEEDQLEKVKGYIETAEKNGVELVLPTDVVVNAGFPAGDTPVAPEVVAADAIPADKMGLDIGPESQKLFHDKIVDSKTVVWNGPMGVFEVPEFAAGTKAVAQGLVDATAAGAFTIVGGGDSASAVRNLGFPEDGFSHISTGGGASLEFLEGKELPGLKVLE